MHLADHIRPLLRDYDCVIIPDFGGLVADASSARAQPGRQALSPPTKLLAFNQALTRNDGLLVDALSQHLGLSIAQAREAVRAAVAALSNTALSGKIIEVQGSAFAAQLVMTTKALTTPLTIRAAVGNLVPSLKFTAMQKLTVQGINLQMPGWPASYGG